MKLKSLTDNRQFIWVTFRIACMKWWWTITLIDPSGNDINFYINLYFFFKHFLCQSFFSSHAFSRLSYSSSSILVVQNINTSKEYFTPYDMYVKVMAKSYTISWIHIQCYGGFACSCWNAEVDEWINNVLNSIPYITPHKWFSPPSVFILPITTLRTADCCLCNNSKHNKQNRLN